MDYEDALSVRYHIKGVQSKGVDISKVGGMSMEKEILLRPGQKFRILSVNKKFDDDFGDFWEVLLEEII